MIRPGGYSDMLHLYYYHCGSHIFKIKVRSVFQLLLLLLSSSSSFGSNQAYLLFAGTPNLVIQINLGHGLDEPWSSYKYGFSDAYGGYWHGLEDVHRMTNNGKIWKFCIDVKDEFGFTFSIPYNQFVQDGESDGYTYLMTGATGNYDFFGTTSRKYKFSTKDRNNQPCCCAEQAGTCKGGWWYACSSSMVSISMALDGVGTCGFYYSLPFAPPIKFVSSYMKLRET